MEDKDKERIQNQIDEAADEGAGHGKIRASIGPDQVGTAGGQDYKGETEGRDGSVGPGVSQDICRGSEKLQKRVQKKEDQKAESDPEREHEENGISDKVLCLLGLFPAHGKIEVGRAADAEEQGDRGAGDGQGESDVGGSVSLHADAVADEELVYHIVEGAHEHGDDTGNGEAGHQMVDRFHAQGIFMLFVQRITSFSSVERKNQKNRSVRRGHRSFDSYYPWK